MLNLSSSYSPFRSIQERNTKGTVVMAPTYSYTQKTTTVSYPWPPTITGVERIALSAQGDLQRVLSAYFARPISIAVVYEHTTWQHSPEMPPEPLEQPNSKAIASASPETPIIQRRQVHLQCSGRIVCTATSTVRITSPNSSHLFLVEKYAIGQMFRRLEKLPVFELLSVGLGPCTENDGLGSGGNLLKSYARPHRELWRRYKLTVPSFDCEIVEVFPDREMFVHGEAWLDDCVVLDGGPVPDSGRSVSKKSSPRGLEVETSTRIPWFAKTNNMFLLALALILMLAYEVMSSLAGSGDRC